MTANGKQNEESVRAALAETQSIAKDLQENGRIVEALDVTLRGLDILKNFFGVGSYDFEKGRIDAARMVLDAALLHQVHGKYLDASNLLAHVDKLTTYSLSAFPVLDRSRLLVRASMLKELIIARHHQGRHRSALTFGRNLINLVKKLCMVWEIPTTHLNLASVYSAMNLHKDALGHCYMAYQYVCKILSAVEDPESHPFISRALEMEAAVKRQDDTGGYRLFEECVSLQQTDQSLNNTENTTFSTPNFQVELGEEENITALNYLLWAGSVKQRRHFPCTELLVACEAAHEPKRSVSEPLQRWGGVLALVFRGIAVEQEHLKESTSALLTYRVAHSTALQCLGEQHPVTVQCQKALADADEAAKRRVDHKPDSKFSTSKVPQQDNTRPRTVSSLSPARKAPNRMNRTTTPAASNSAFSKTLPPRPQRERPDWNPWFNSKDVPSSSIVPKPTTAPADMSTQGRFESTMPSTAGSGDDGGVDSLPPLRSFTSMERRQAREYRPKEHKKKQYYDEEEEIVPINAADYSFLQQTFKLKHDPSYQPMRRRAQKDPHDQIERRALATEKKLAKALAVEMGINTDE